MNIDKRVGPTSVFDGSSLTRTEMYISDAEPGQSPSSWYPLIHRGLGRVVAREKRPGAPNITLNLHKQTRDEVHAAAVFGIVLQVGILLYAGFATYYPTLRFPKEEEDPVAGYAFPCMATGTVALVLGLMLCGHVVESSTEEKMTRTGPGFEARHIWLQRRATVGDQVFGSCAIFPSDPQVTMVTSQRSVKYEPTILDRLILGIPVMLVSFLHKEKNKKRKKKNMAQGRDHSAILESKTTIGTVISVVGFIVQFVGLRGVHWSISIFQLGAVLVMTLVRVYIRRVHARPPLFLPLPPGFELDWFAMSLLEDEAAPWVTRHEKEAEMDDETEPEEEKSESEDTCSLCEGSWRVLVDRAPYSRLYPHEDSPQTQAQGAVMIRKQLAELAGWRSLVHAEASVLKRAMELTMDALLSWHRAHRLVWSVEAEFRGIKSQAVQFQINFVNSVWTADLGELEAALSLWIYSVDQEYRTHQQRRDDDDDGRIEDKLDEEREEDWFSTEELLRSFSLRSLGRNTKRLRRDLCWWMPRNMGGFMKVWPEGQTPPAENKAMDLTMQRPRAVGPGLCLANDSVRWCGQPSSLLVHRGGIHMWTYDADVDDDDDDGTLIALDCFYSLKTLYAQELFSAFMWAVAKETRFRIRGGAGVQASEVPGQEGTRNPMDGIKLSNKALSTLANSIQATGLGNLDTVYALLIPPLSAENKLPAAYEVVELARKEALPHEQRGKLFEAGRVYLRLGRMMATLPEDDAVATKAAALLVQHRKRLDEELRHRERYKGFYEAHEVLPLQSQKMWVDKALAVRQSGVLSGLDLLYDYRWKTEDEEEPEFPPSFSFTHMHRMVCQRKCHLDSSANWLGDGLINMPDVFGRTPVHYVATMMSGNRDMLSKLRYIEGRVNAVDMSGRTPLHYACEQPTQTRGQGEGEAADDDDSFVIRHLLEAGADVNAQARDGRRPIHCAAEQGACNLLVILAEAGATVDVLDATGRSPLMLAALGGHKDAAVYLKPLSNRIVRDVRGRNVLHMAAASGSAEMTALFTDDAYYTQDRRGDTPLNIAALTGRVDVVRFLMERFGDAGGTKSSKPRAGSSPLHSAISTGQADVVRLLIRDMGIDKDTPGSMGWTPLRFAVWCGQESMVRLLATEFGVDMEARDEVGFTPLMRAVSVSQGSLSLIKTMIEELGCNVHVRNPDGSTLLHEASRYPITINIPPYLVREHHIDVNARNNAGETPLHCAGLSGRHELMRSLLEMGADPSARNSQGQTPLHTAARLLHFDRDVMEALIQEFGMDDEAVDAQGRTPQMMADEFDVARTPELTGRED